MERRAIPRSRVTTRVYLVRRNGQLQRCRARNLSAIGVFLETDTLGLPSGTQVRLVFAVNLGPVVRLHRRKAVVAHVNETGAGLIMQSKPQLPPGETPAESSLSCQHQSV